MVSALAATWGIAALATGGVILRPWRLPEAAWAVAGAALLVLSGLLPAAEAWRGVANGTDVYLFLIGMMLLAEIARQEGLFDWLAAQAATHARGSATRLFTLVYLRRHGRHRIPVQRRDGGRADACRARRSHGRRRPRTRCPICSSAPSSPMPPRSSCRSPTRPIW